MKFYSHAQHFILEKIYLSSANPIKTLGSIIIISPIIEETIVKYRRY